MSLFAHTETGFALDPQENASADEYRTRFAEGVSQGWTVTEVPSGTQHGAKDNGNGTFTNPVVSTPTPQPRILSKTQFQDYVVTVIGGVPDGMARFTEIMDATRDSASGAVRFAFARYEAAATFEKDNTGQLTAIMANDSTTGHLTSVERSAILGSWPIT